MSYNILLLNIYIKESHFLNQKFWLLIYLNIYVNKLKYKNVAIIKEAYLYGRASLIRRALPYTQNKGHNNDLYIFILNIDLLL